MGRKDAHQGERALAERGFELDAELDEARSNARERERAANRKGRGGGRGKGRGGRRERANEYERSVHDIQAETEAFLRQADAIAKVTTAGGDWERALAIIEEEQKLLNAAQKAGVELTPQVTQSIREMAEAHVDAEDKLERIRTATERGQDAMEGFFGSILDGVDSARDALVQLLEQIAKVQFAKGMMGLFSAIPGGSAIMQGIGGSCRLMGVATRVTAHVLAVSTARAGSSPCCTPMKASMTTRGGRAVVLRTSMSL
ncbi:hypothetical protein ACFSS8_05910 [Paracoccus kondratievae]